MVAAVIWSLEVGDQLRVTLQVNRLESSFHFIGEHAALGGLRTPKGCTTIRAGPVFTTPACLSPDAAHRGM